MSEVELLFLDSYPVGPDYDAMVCALEALGVHVYENPNTEGSSTMGLVLSKRKLSKKEIKQFCNDEFR